MDACDEEHSSSAIDTGNLNKFKSPKQPTSASLVQKKSSR